MEQGTKPLSKIGQMKKMLEEDFYTKEELVAASGVAHSTVNVQLSSHIKNAGYAVHKKDGKYHIVKKVDIDDIVDETMQKRAEAENAEAFTPEVAKEPAAPEGIAGEPDDEEEIPEPSEEDIKKIPADEAKHATDKELDALLDEVV